MEIVKFASDNKIKLTPPQLAIAKKIDSGKRLISVNNHRMSGGEFYWIDSDDNLNSISYAGSVYKAYFNLIRVLKKVDKNIDDQDYISKLRNVVY